MNLNDKDIQTISSTLKDHGVIAFPTDTVWGMGCLVEDEQAVKKIYELKTRDKNKPLILLSNNIKFLLPYIEKLPPLAKRLAQQYFPGPLTIVVKKSALTPDFITSGFETVGIRVPEHHIFCEMVDKAVESHVLATTSANISGAGSVARKEDVIDVDYIMDDYGFPAEGKESTVVAVDENNNLQLLRKGAIEHLMI